MLTIQELKESSEDNSCKSQLPVEDVIEVNSLNSNINLKTDKSIHCELSSSESFYAFSPRKRKRSHGRFNPRKRKKVVYKVVVNTDDDDDEDDEVNVCGIDGKGGSFKVGGCETVGPNVFRRYESPKAKIGKRPIFIDGNNIALAHGNGREFSVEGLKMCIDYFRSKGHKVKAFVPGYRLKSKRNSNPRLLQQLVDENIIVVTPTLTVRNRVRIPYDNWYVVQSAAIEDGIIVSRNSYQDIIKMNPALQTIVEERRLVPTFVNDILMFPMDPLGNGVHNLESFLLY